MEKFENSSDAKVLLGGTLRQFVGVSEVESHPQESSRLVSTYHELESRHLCTEDLLVSFRAQVSRLQEASDRLQFLAKEIKYILKA